MEADAWDGYCSFAIMQSVCPKKPRPPWERNEGAVGMSERKGAIWQRASSFDQCK